MSDFRKRPWFSGKLVSSAIQELFEPVGYRKDKLGLPRETKVFEGERITMRAGVLYPDYLRALTGQSGTLTQGTLIPGPIEYQWFVDTFTDTNGTNITSHSETDTWVEIVASGGTGEPQIQSNRVRNLGTSDNWVGYCNYPPYGEGAYQSIESVFYRRATTTGGGANELTEAITFRVEDFGAGIWDGYLFGWSEADDTWYLKRNNNFSGLSDLASSTTNAFTGTSQSRTLKVVISDPDSSTVNIKCYVNGTEVIDYDDTAATRLSNPIRGLGVYFWLSDSVDIDSISAVEQLNKLVGQRATLTGGTLSPFWYPVPGAYLSPGHSVTVTGGTLLPQIGDGTNVQLTGLGITSASGALGPQVGAGAGTTAGALLPKLTASNVYGNHARKGYVTNSYVRVNGTFLGVAEVFSNDISSPFGVLSTDDVYPSSVMTSDTGIGTSNAFLFGSGEYSAWRFNEGEYGGGMFSFTPDGARQSAHYRSLPYYTTFFSVFSQSVPHYLAWKNWTYGWGAPLFLGASNSDGELIGNRAVTALGIYAQDVNTAVALHLRRVDPSITGRQARLTGNRIAGSAGTITAAFNGLGTVELVGRSVSVNQGALGVDGAPVLTGHSITSGIGTLLPVNTNDQLALVVSRAYQSSTVWQPLAETATVTGGGRIYPKPNILCVVPTGYGNKVYAVYVNNPPESASPYIGVAVLDLDAGAVVAHSNVATVGQVDSFVIGSDIYGQHTRQERSVAEVVKLSNGTSVTQFLIDRHVVHLSWTSGTVDAPTVTVKAGPSVAGYNGSPPEQIIDGWETLAYRGDSVYHVLYRYTFASGTHDRFESISKVYVNDVTGTGSTWTLTATTNTGGTTGPTGWSSEKYIAPTETFYGGANHSGYGGGSVAWLRADREPDNAGGDNSDMATVDVEFWDNSYPLLSVEARGAVGPVSVTITPYADVTLTGHRATFEQGIFNEIRSGADRSVKLNKFANTYRMTLRGGLCLPPSFDFVQDTFTEGSDVSLYSHVGEIGATWTRLVGSGGIDARVDGANVYIPFAATTDLQIKATASGESPTPDYVVTALPTIVASQSYFPVDTPSFAIGARCYGTNGYYFGYYVLDDEWMLFKGSTLITRVARTDFGSLGEVKLVVSTVTSGAEIAARIRCYHKDVLVIDYLDTPTYTSSPYVGAGRVGIWINGYETARYGLAYINGTYYDATALVLPGQRATFAQGQLTGPWLVGQRATFTQGVLTPLLLPPVEVALTGLSATFAQGTLYHAEGVLTGNAATVSGGTLVMPITAALVGQRINVYQGTASLLNRELPSLSAAVIRGDMGVVVDAYPTLPGYAVTFAAGTLTPAHTYALQGHGATLTGGEMAAHVSVTLQGQQAVGGIGAISRSAATSVELAGAALACTGGTLVPGTGEQASLTGGGLTGSIGTLVPVVSTALLGRAGTVGGGGFVPVLACTPQGQIVVSAAGVLQLLTNIFLTGTSGTFVHGVMGPQYGCNVYPVGVAATGAVGDVRDRFMPEQEIADLFFTDMVDEVAVDAEVEELFVLVRPP